jgi:hypothetical protein
METVALEWPARLSRLLDNAWQAGLAQRPPLDPAAIVAAAARREGALPAPGAWRIRLDNLCASLEQEARLSALGRTIAFGQLVRLVAARVRAERLLARHPAITARAAEAPVVVVGQMRSGTTRVHRLLACDPHFAHTRLFETLDPVPYDGAIDRRVPAAVAAMGLVRLCNPALAAIHPVAPFAPEEEFGLHAFSLWGAQFEGQWHVPGFVAKCEAAGADEVREMYREFRSLLQIAGHARGLGAGRRWLLKAPQFCHDMDALLGVFPDARIVRLDRAPAAVVGSGASLVWNQMRIQSDHADRAAIGREWLRKTVLRQRQLDVALGGVEHLVLDFDEVSRDWRAAMERVYDFLGKELTPAVEARMARLMARSTAHRGHRYALEAFGLDEGMVCAAMA